MPRERERTSSWLFEIRIRHLSCLRALSIAVSLRRPQRGGLEGRQWGRSSFEARCASALGMTGRTVVPVEAYDSRISNSRRPSVLSNFFTALEAMTSPWLA
jgi:hypothetical protein